MEQNDELKSEISEEAEVMIEAMEDAAPADETMPVGRFNLEICPNCLEPNDEDLAVCPFCGQPLTPGAEIDPAVMAEDEKTLKANREAAVSEEKEEKKPQENGFRRIMPWLGLYLIYYAVTGVFETAHNEELKDVKLAYLSWVIWAAAGILMGWPLIKKGWNKIHPAPEKPEETSDAPETEASGPAEYEEEVPDEADEEADEDENSDETPDAEEESYPDFEVDDAPDEAPSEEDDGQPEA